jgi:iron complex outermembrane receptor protein
MRSFIVRILGVLALAIATTAPQALAQQGNLLIRVSDNETAAPLQNVNVEVFASGADQALGGLTDASGSFRISLAPGTYRVVVSLLGYADYVENGVRIAAGESTTLVVPLRSRAEQLDPIVVTGSRGRPQKALEAPAQVSVVSRERIEERAALTPIEHLKNEPGVDIVQTGLTQSNVVARGFNNVFSGAMLTITDNRYAFVPSLRVNAFNFIATTSLDLERIETVLGPAAALYGPNSAQGVMHMMTASPIDRPGGQIELAGGTRSVLQGAGRFAYANDSETFGIKVSGLYFRGEDWEYNDPVEDANRKALEDAGLDPGLVAQRDFDAERYSGEARMDFRPNTETEIVFQGGFNNAASSIELTGIGAGQAKDWTYSYAQGWFSWNRLFAQAFMNASDAGDTYLLRTGDPIVDKSKMYATQLQHGFTVGEFQDFIYGIDAQWTRPDTEGTINGANEDNDNITEYGAYIHSETGITDNFDLVLALRVDDHSALEDVNWSPRAALVWRPQENHNIRFTWNRAFSTPTTNNLFLDLRASRIPLTPEVGYDVRTLGVPNETGFTFTPTDQCAAGGGLGGYCMYSPFAPGQRLPASAAPFWNAGIGTVLAAAAQQGLLSPAQAAALTVALAGGGSQVGSILRRLNTEGDDPFPVDDVFLSSSNNNIAPIKPTIYNTFEAGYQGLIADKLRLSGSLYFSRIEDFVGPLRVENPNVFFNPQEAAAFIGGRLAALAQGGLLPAEQVPVLTAAITAGIAQIPFGTVHPDQRSNEDIILTYRNFGEVDFWGGDLFAQLLFTNEWSMAGTYSYVSQDCFEFSTATADGSCTSAQDVALNAPKNKFTLSGRYDSVRNGFSSELRVRYVDGFPMNSGVYTGFVDSYTLLDFNAAWRLPMAPGASLGLTATNLLDERAQQFIGAPELGRMVLLRLGYAW